MINVRPSSPQIVSTTTDLDLRSGTINLELHKTQTCMIGTERIIASVNRLKTHIFQPTQSRLQWLCSTTVSILLGGDHKNI